MDNTQRAVNIVNWMLDHWVQLAIGLVAVVVTAFVVSGLAYLRKRYLSKRTEDAVEGWAIHKTLVGASLLFGGLDYFLPFLQQNIEVLKSLKFVGPFVVSVYAAANFLYALKFKSWFKAIEAYLQKRADKKASDALAVQSQPPALQPPTVPESPFEAQV
jgi:hypothetical protein